jgi:hypothetical protein
MGLTLRRAGAAIGRATGAARCCGVMSGADAASRAMH